MGITALGSYNTVPVERLPDRKEARRAQEAMVGGHKPRGDFRSLSWLFLRQGLTTWLWLFWNTLRRPCWTELLVLTV